jgi:hypothetical protein
MFSATPTRPWSALALACAVGTLLGVLAVSVWQALTVDADLQSRLVLLADAVPVTVFALPVVAVVALLYACPLLWVLVRYRLCAQQRDPCVHRFTAAMA